MNDFIVEKIENLDDSKDYYSQDLYGEIISDIYRADKLYVALSPAKYDPESGTGVPGIFTKDGFPAIYIFTNEDAARNWSVHYGNIKIALLNNHEITKNPFNSLFQTAAALGAKCAFVNEGLKFLCFPIKDFFCFTDAARDPEMILESTDTESMIKEVEANGLDFNPAKAVI